MDGRVGLNFGNMTDLQSGMMKTNAGIADNEQSWVAQVNQLMAEWPDIAGQEFGGLSDMAVKFSALTNEFLGMLSNAVGQSNEAHQAAFSRARAEVNGGAGGVS
jgi:hypothetical protein